VSGLPELPRLPEVGDGEEVEVRQYDLDVLSLQVAREPEPPPPAREYWCRPLEVKYKSRRGDTLTFHPYACYSEDPRLLGGELAQLFIYAKPALAAAESDPVGLEELEFTYHELIIIMFDDPIRVLLRDRQSTPIPVFFAPATGGFVAVAVLKGNMYRLGGRTVGNMLKDIKHILDTATPGVDQEQVNPEGQEEGGLGGKTVREILQEVRQALSEEEKRASRVLVVEVGAG
jgi:hypothetical protein